MAETSELLRLAPPPGDSLASPVDWDGFETSLGMRLPADYKWLVDTYGPGKFAGFLHVLQPYHESRYITVTHNLERGRDILRQVSAHETIPYNIDQLMPAATTDNGDMIYWITCPFREPDAWRITGNEARNTVWPFFDGGIVDFLVSILSGRRHFEIFPRDFPRTEVTFARYPVSRHRGLRS